jgi:cell division septation protein DedD
LGVARPRRRLVVPSPALWAVAVVGAAALLGVWLAGRPQPPSAPSTPPAGLPEPAAASAPDSAARSARSAGVVEGAERADSLFYSVQVAAFNQADQALSYARGVPHEAGPATVSAVRLGRQGLWYRVIVGAFPTAAGADSLLRTLWDRGVVERPNGTILRTPHAYLIERQGSAEAAADRVEGLRRRGVAAYIVSAPDGSAQVLAGAFEGPDQAGAADSLLRLQGLTGTLVQRMGIRR